MATRLKLTGVLALTAAFAACAQGEVTSTGGGGGPDTSASSGGAASVASHSASSSAGSTGGMGGKGGAPTTSSTVASSGGFVTVTSGTGGMSLCGNGQLDPGEQCDGSNFGTATCQTLGLDMGNLACNSACHIVVSGCTPPENCTNGQDDNGDGLIDCQDPECTGKPGCVDSCLPTASGTVGTDLFGDTTGRPSVHHASCSSATSGPEQIYQVTAPSTGLMSVTFTNDSFSSPPNFSVSVRTTCAMDSSEITCDAKTTADEFGDITIAFAVPVTMGQTYFVMIQGLTPTDFGSYDLDLEMVMPETTCDDLIDNDFDGYVDCDDATNCQTLAGCHAGTKATGVPCTKNSQCTANHNDPICLSSSAWPGGYCSEFCDLTLQDCSAGNICYGGLNLSVNGVCLHECTANSDCGAGYACVDAGLASKVCMIAPESDCNDYLDNDGDGLIDCQDPTACQTLPACTPGTKAVGQPCTMHSDCTASAGVNNPFCFDADDEDEPNGYCSHFCDPTQPADCGAGAVCGDAGLGVGNTCFKTCTSDAQCRTMDGYVCEDLGFPKMVCFF